jgi:hypothetical protein
LIVAIRAASADAKAQPVPCASRAVTFLPGASSVTVPSS